MNYTDKLIHKLYEFLIPNFGEYVQEYLKSFDESMKNNRYCFRKLQNMIIE